MGWGGWDDVVPWTCKHASLRVVGWGGWGGWEDKVLHGYFRFIRARTGRSGLRYDSGV